MIIKVYHCFIRSGKPFLLCVICPLEPYFGWLLFSFRHLYVNFSGKYRYFSQSGTTQLLFEDSGKTNSMLKNIEDLIIPTLISVLKTFSPFSPNIFMSSKFHQ